MLKKIDWAKQFLKEQQQQFACPYCQAQCDVTDGYSMICAQQHTFNLSKKGTMHLMKQPANTDYDRELFTHRHALMTDGFFEPVLDVLAQYIDPTGLIVDAGCGEGSHLAYLQDRLQLSRAIGIDIAKEGIALASQHFANRIFWSLADLTHLPLQDNSCQTLLNILTPSHYAEFKRVLAKGGYLLKVVPGIHYLRELREQLYQDNKQKQVYDNQQMIAHFAKECPGYEQKQVTYTYKLTPDMYTHLLHMTPLYWGASPAMKAASLANPLPQITVDVTILVYRK